jgi:hypothetical protein
MSDNKRHPAAHSGAPAPAGREGGQQSTGQAAATHDMKHPKPLVHPQPGCSPKVAGSVTKRTGA